MPTLRDRITELLWPPGRSARTEVWAIVDAARHQSIYGAVHASYQDKFCLFAGDLHWQIQMVAPYLIHLSETDQFTRQMIDNGWGKAWGIFLRTDTDARSIRRHLRTFLRVRDRSGRKLLFRYYDPRVLRLYLPTCVPDELRTVFGPVKEYLLESKDSEGMLEFRFDGTKLVQRRFELAPTATVKA